MAKEPEVSIANLTGDQLISYLHTLSQRQAEYSKLKIKLTEELMPIQQDMAAKKAAIQTVIERQRQCKTEIAACKYSIKSCAEGLT